MADAAGGMRCAEVADLAAPFVLGALEPAEADAVRQHLATCPEAHAEVAELGGVVPALFESVDLVEPPDALRGRILAAAAADQATAPAPAFAPGRAPTPAPAITPGRAAPPLPITAPVNPWARRFSRPVWAATAMAAAVALLVMGAWNLQLRGEIDGLTTYRDGVVHVLEQAAQPGAQLAVLADPGGTGGPSGLAAVAADGSVALVMRDLAPTSGTQVYEAWLIAADAAPVPIGGFTVGADGSAAFATDHAWLGSGVTVALTLEPAPGASTPTVPIIAVGTTAAQSS